MTHSHNDMQHSQTDGSSDANACCGPGYASPEEAMQAEREQLLYTVALYGGTAIQAPD